MKVEEGSLGLQKIRLIGAELFLCNKNSNKFQYECLATL